MITTLLIVGSGLLATPPVPDSGDVGIGFPLALGISLAAPSSAWLMASTTTFAWSFGSATLSKGGHAALVAPTFTGTWAFAGSRADLMMPVATLAPALTIAFSVSTTFRKGVNYTLHGQNTPFQFLFNSTAFAYHSRTNYTLSAATKGLVWTFPLISFDASILHRYTIRADTFPVNLAWRPVGFRVPDVYTRSGKSILVKGDPQSVRIT